MHEARFTITFNRHLSQLTWLLSVYGILLTIYFWYYGLSFPEPYIYVFIFIFVTDILPTLMLHVQYWLANKGAVLTVSREFNRLTYSDRFQSLTYGLDEIAGLLHVASYGGGSWYSFSEYRYFRIIFRDGKEIVITSLMVKDMKFLFEMLLGLKANKKLRVYAFIRNDG